MLSIISVFLGLALLIIFAMKGWNVILSALISAFVVIVLSGLDLREALYNSFMPAFGNWAARFFLMIFAGGVFAKLNEASGAAQSISNALMNLAGRGNIARNLIAVWFVTYFFTYVGITAWVIIFVMIPIIYPIFKELDLPWHIALATFSLGANCTANALPGAVILYNVMPMQYLGTSAMAGWKIALFATPVGIALGFAYIYWLVKKAKANNERFVKPDKLNIDEMAIAAKADNLPHVGIAVTPILVTLLTLNIFKIDPAFALALGCISNIVLMYKRLPNLVKILGDGASTVATPVATTCAVVGFGSVVASTSGYQVITDAIIQGIPGSPYISWVTGINLLAGITGSASGGLGIALESLLPKYMALGLNPEALHRLAAFACIGLDSLPHNGAIVTIMMIFGLSHKEGYKHIFVLSVLIALIILIPGVIAAMIFY